MSYQDCGFGESWMRPGEPWRDTRRIDVREPGEIEYWAKSFGVDNFTLLVAIDKVGTEAVRVGEFLRRHPSLH